MVRTGGVAVLSGPAGIGKSRLVAEASSLAVQDGMIVAMGRATPPESRTQPYAPIRKALFQVVRHFGVPDDDGLAGWRGALGAVLPTHLLGTQPVEAEPSLVGEAVLQLLGRVPPLVMVLEDLHWADPDTIAMIDYLADAAAGHRTAWLLTTRDAPCSATRSS